MEKRGGKRRRRREALPHPRTLVPTPQLFLLFLGIAIVSGRAFGLKKERIWLFPWAPELPPAIPSAGKGWEGRGASQGLGLDSLIFEAGKRIPGFEKVSKGRSWVGIPGEIPREIGRGKIPQPG